jgi:hypothetical protein
MTQQVYTDLEMALNLDRLMDFCDAYHQLKYGHVVKRRGWELGSALKLYVVPKDDNTVDRGIYLVVNGKRTLWEPTQSDITAEDWLIVH